MPDPVGSVSEGLRWVWKIPDFFQEFDNCSTHIASPEILYPDCRWIATVMYVGPRTDGKAATALFPKQTMSTATKKSVKCIIGSDRLNLCAPIITPNEEMDFGEQEFSFRIDLDNLKRRKSELVPSDTLTITFYIGEDVWEPPKAYTRRLMALENLSSNFGDLFATKKKTDATIKVVDKEFPVHRAVLVARSSVFSAMFDHDMSEEKTGVVKVPDCDPDSFQDFLHYLYTGKFERVTPTNALHLYVTSNKYDVQELKSFCVDYMTENLTVENVLDVVALAERHGESELLSSAQDFFNHNFVEVISTCRWMTLMEEDREFANKLLLQMGSQMEIKHTKRRKIK